MRVGDRLIAALECPAILIYREFPPTRLPAGSPPTRRARLSPEVLPAAPTPPGVTDSSRPVVARVFHTASDGARAAHEAPRGVVVAPQQETALG